jgi:UDP-2,3-diacylglucosamine pyrophosphatase LpxH
MEQINTLFFSDLHLGTKKSRPDKLLEVFEKYQFKKLVIIGDFIDLTKLSKKIYWKNDHSKVIQKVLKYSRKKVEVVYILGNHDCYLRELIKDKDINLGKIKICNEHIHNTIKNESIYICHGDSFDGFVALNPILYRLGDWGYELSFKIGRWYNLIRKIVGLKPWSISKYLKRKVKNAISYINDFKTISIKKIIEMKSDSIMIGHIHTPEIEIGEYNYYNTGDFCESCSYIIEDLDGNIKLMYQND